MADDVKPSEKFADPESILRTFMPLDSIGTSASGNAIWGKHLGGSGERVLFIGGVHGNETEGVAATLGYFNEFFQDGKITEPRRDIYFIPVMNPDGFLKHSRHNGNGVDLNRNMPTADWKQNDPSEKYYSGPAAASEPETQILIKVLEEFKPDFIVSLHSWKPMFNVNGPAHGHAKRMHAELAYEITEDIGYPTPGSLGTYTGWERKVPTITFEIERGLALDTVYATVRGAILSVV
jgi:murein peptide amidase A